MKHGILNRVAALCMAGVMIFALVACGDSEDKDKGEEVSQEIIQSSEDETVEVAQNEETDDTVDSFNNEILVAHVSSSGDGGNGSAIPIVKPGEEPGPGEEPQTGDEQKPGAGTQPNAEPKPGAGTQPNAEPKPGTEPQQPPQSQQTQSGEEPPQPQQPQQPEPNTENQTAHVHNWVTETLHHEGTGHYENKVTGQEQVVVGYTPKHEETYCNDCGALVGTDIDKSSPLWFLRTGHNCAGTNNLSLRSVITGGDPIYETRDKWENVWVVDTVAWDETVTTCSTCGAKQ